jgi:protein associated with RNAse G/E
LFLFFSLDIVNINHNLKGQGMNPNNRYTIKSFKHDGHLHRMWLENWRVPGENLHPSHAAENMLVFVNDQTRIQEADGKEWISKIPGVSFFIPDIWYNIVALIEEAGIRYYCNLASPPYLYKEVLTYIDYDLDVIMLPDGNIRIVDKEEYEYHKIVYHYSPLVQEKVEEALNSLLKRMKGREAPFHNESVYKYYTYWKEGLAGGGL